MTVKELKNILSELDDDTPVFKTEGDFYPEVRHAEVTAMYKLSEVQKRSASSLCTRKFMTADRWFGNQDYNKDDPRITDVLLVI